MANPPYAQGKVLDSRYRIEGQTQGGMGIVLFCKDTKDQSARTVVLKTLFEKYLADENARRRFENEATAWIRMGDVSKTSIVPLYEVKRIEGMPFLIMMYCPNGDLSRIISNNDLSVEEKLVIASHVLIGMHIYSDEYGIIHRDLKPQNVLLDASNIPRISDFGLVKLANMGEEIVGNEAQSDKSLTQYRSFMGTLLYASPEQLMDSKNVDCRTDIWAFGVILYELLLGVPPFIGDSEENIVKSIFYHEPNFAEIRRVIGKPGEAVLAKCLAKDKTARY